LVGDAETKKLFSDVPNTICLHPMDWPTYRNCAGVVKSDIGLAPLIGGRFNCGRAHTKFYDITRLGAVGVYSNRAPYAGFIRDGVDGLLLENDPGAWGDAIVRLSEAPERRKAILTEARARAEGLLAVRTQLPLDGMQSAAVRGALDGLATARTVGGGSP
jgi:hypothetical protein